MNFKNLFLSNEKGSTPLIIIFGLAMALYGFEIINEENGGIKNVLLTQTGSFGAFFGKLSGKAVGEKETLEDLDSVVSQREPLDRKTLLKIGPGVIEGEGDTVNSRARLAASNPVKNVWNSLKESLKQRKDRGEGTVIEQNKDSSWLRYDNQKREPLEDIDNNERSNLGKFIEEF